MWTDRQIKGFKPRDGRYRLSEPIAVLMSVVMVVMPYCLMVICVNGFLD